VGLQHAAVRYSRSASSAGHHGSARPPIAATAKSRVLKGELPAGNLRVVEYPEENAFIIYTDGSMLWAPRGGGGAVISVLVRRRGERRAARGELADRRGDPEPEGDRGHPGDTYAGLAHPLFAGTGSESTARFAAV
jgi:hypothetical protein